MTADVTLAPFKRHTPEHWSTKRYVDEIVEWGYGLGLRCFLDFGTAMKPPFSLPKNAPRMRIRDRVRWRSWNSFPFWEWELLKQLGLTPFEDHRLLDPFSDAEHIRYTGSPPDGSSVKDIVFSSWARRQAKDLDWLLRQIMPLRRRFRLAFDFMAVRNENGICGRLMKELMRPTLGPEKPQKPFIEANPKVGRWEQMPFLIRDDTAFKRENNKRFRQPRPGDMVIIIKDRANAYESAAHWVHNYGCDIAVPYNWLQNGMIDSMLELTRGGVGSRRRAA